MLRHPLRLRPTAQLRAIQPTLRPLQLARLATSAAAPPTGELVAPPEAHPLEELGEDGRRHRFLYYSGVMPIRSQLGWWDIRYLFAKMEEDTVVERIKALTPNCPHNDLQVEGVFPRAKDGGVFAKFSFIIPPEDASDPRAEAKLLDQLEREAREAVEKSMSKGWDSWTRITGSGGVFLVKGLPWAEDMTHRSRFPSQTIRVEFDGPDLGQEELYSLFRPYGKIYNIIPQPASNKDTPRFANVVFTGARAAAAARNTLHAAVVPANRPAGAPPAPPTSLRILYVERPNQQYVRDFITGHPRIAIPVLVALLGTVSLFIFDPIREMAVKTHVQGTFDADKWKLISWLKRETLGRLGFADVKKSTNLSGVERERAEARDTLDGWLRDAPNSFITVTGPDGSGKTALVQEVVKERDNVLMIDCAEIVKNGRTDTKLVSALADAVGYWPEFSMGASVNNLIDLASMSLTGQKAGFSSAVDVQLKAILEVAASALASVAAEARSSSEKAAKLAERKRLAAEAEREAHAVADVKKLEQDGVRDGRIDTVAGSGPIAELGAGVEKALADEAAVVVGPRGVSAVKALAEAILAEPKEENALLPVVVLKNYASKGEAKNDLLWDVLAEWAAVLTENQVAHVVFLSDSVTINKPLAHALPNSPFHSLRLNDASESAAWEYVKNKLAENDMDLREEERPFVAQLGGRQTDLELLVQKIHAGFELEAAVEDLVERNAMSIRKNFFGDDAAEAEALPWTPAMAWAMVRGLTEKDELKYGAVLVNSPFKGNETALRALETAELISVVHVDGRPSLIRPGKPVYRSAFNRLRQDKGWEAALRYRVNQASQKSAMKDLTAAEDRLAELSKLFGGQGGWVFGGGMRVPPEVEDRVGMLLAGMRDAEERLAKLGKEEAELLDTLAKVE